MKKIVNVFFFRFRPWIFQFYYFFIILKRLLVREFLCYTNNKFTNPWKILYHTTIFFNFLFTFLLKRDSRWATEEFIKCHKTCDISYNKYEKEIEANPRSVVRNLSRISKLSSFFCNNWQTFSPRKWNYSGSQIYIFLYIYIYIFFFEEGECFMKLNFLSIVHWQLQIPAKSYFSSVNSPTLNHFTGLFKV